MSSYDIVVVGGGVVGLSAAIAMSKHGFSVALVDASDLKVDTHSIDPRVYAINTASQILLQSLGVWEKLDKTRQSLYTHMHVWDATNNAHIDFDARMMGTDRLGVILEESIIKKALLQVLSQQPVTLFPKCPVIAIQERTKGMDLQTTEQRLQASLVIIADGANSVTRQLLKVSLTSWPYHQQALVTTVQTEKPHRQTAYQVFHPDGPLAFLPLFDPYQCSIVWSTSTKQARYLMELNPEQFTKHLMHAFSSKLGHCSEQGKRYQFPLQMRHTKQYSGSHWLLMGDAAHTIHPMAGLGLNVGLADLATWNALIEQKGRWSAQTLAAYQRERKYNVWKTIALLETLKVLFSNPLSPTQVLRGIGLQACNQLLPLKRWLIEQASH